MKKYPKVLVTCIDAWRDDVGANTLPNFFSEWESEKIFVVYTKSELPDSTICNNFFQISENEVMHSIFRPGKKCGEIVPNVRQKKNEFEKQIETEDENVKEERKRYAFFRNHRFTLFYLLRDVLWDFGTWKSKELDDFLQNIEAEVMFIPIYPYAYMNKIQAYIAKKTGLRGVAYIADDNYSYKPEWYNPMFWIRRFFLRKSIDNLMQYCDELLVILPKLKKEYERLFKLPINVLTKGIETDKELTLQTETTLPLKMIYTGNLFIGRDKTLIEIVKAIKKINQSGQKIYLEIYSHIPLSNKLKNKLNESGCSTFKGSIPISQVEKIQKDADIVLFVEGLDLFNCNKARLSFSTKLTDYFKSGKCIFAVGKTDIAPIDYLIKNECAIVASTKKEIYEQLLRIVTEPDKINIYGKKAFELGMEKHSNAVMKEVLYESLLKVSKK